MSPEQLDEARAREAVRLASGCCPTNVYEVAGHALRLAREGWEPVDPDLIEAREIVARRVPDRAAAVGIGKWDATDSVLLALAGIRRGRQLAEGSLP
jgi:hypothetical protein